MAVTGGRNPKALPSPPRERCSIWARETFRKALETRKLSDRHAAEKLKDQLIKLGIIDKRIDGFAIMGLPQTQEGRGGGINYTDVFHEVVTSTGDSNPIDYLYKLTEYFISKENDDDKLGGFLARGLRTFPSLARDRDFGIVFETMINETGAFRDYELVVDPIEDAAKHTDVLFRVNGKDYRIWLFQYSPRGLPHDIERLTGERGKLPAGIHVLCPLKTEIEQQYSHTKDRITSMNVRIGALNAKLKEIKKGTKKAAELAEKLKRYSAELDKLSDDEKRLRPLFDDEMFVKEGWFFYSEKKIEAVLELIKNISHNKATPDSYEWIYSVLIAPKRYLAKISAFEVKR
ncbi:Uncharacterised protein [Candidatus Norongarragalina meridionalis]|nr:Uncharacterised protein [Candidatus Norongarragalina meridionalis]